MALRALDINPSDARAYLALSVSAQNGGDLKTAIEHARKAVSLQPSFPRALAQLGVSYAFSGQPEKGVRAIERAMRLDPASPRQPYLNQLAVANVLAGKYEAAIEALDRNRERGGPHGPHMMVFRAAALSALGRIEEEQATLEELVEVAEPKPGLVWIEQWLHRLTPDQSVVAPLLDELKKAENLT